MGRKSLMNVMFRVPTAFVFFLSLDGEAEKKFLL